ncbi:MAG: methylmalonyl Co-A mutase-associated GTPase MeaB [Acidobacteriaceae bacterium]|nr:methylmalonyl Co-A mutase-associated GTPase MeaB [Acidobacteriaceae bacterium]
MPSSTDKTSLDVAATPSGVAAVSAASSASAPTVGTAARPRGRARQPLEWYVDGVLAGDRVALSRAITLVESTLPSDVELSALLLNAILPSIGKTRRLGITGVPGVGKSTFIDALGMHVARECGEQLAVLSVDPSSPISGGSILGDKTRMAQLSMEERAYIRPSPSGGHLGGVARRTRETILLCEAAGFTNIFIETVGVGQSETAVRSMSDFFLLLMLAGAGDELQGIKRGIIEMVDGMAINKADGDNKPKAERARIEYASALHMFPPSGDGWTPQVVCCSALQNTGIDEIWQMVLDHEVKLEALGKIEERRRKGALQWMNELISMGLEDIFCKHPVVADRLPVLQQEVRDGRTTPLAASFELLRDFRQ